MNCVSINLRKNKTIIKIEDNANQEDILKELKKKVTELKKLYKEEQTPICVTGKVLNTKELQEIKEFITSKIDVEVTFDTPQTLGLHSITRSYKKNVKKSETIFHKGSLRSGQRIEVEGSIVIIGDVNAGAEIIAGENIVVVGNLRGLAHAGAKGNINAIISASKLDVVQLRISNIVKEIDKEEEEIYEQAYIYACDDEIIIE